MHDCIVTTYQFVVYTGPKRFLQGEEDPYNNLTRILWN